MPSRLKHHLAIVAAAAALGLGAASAAPPPLPPSSWEVSGEFDYLSPPWTFSNTPLPTSNPLWRYGWGTGTPASFNSLISAYMVPPATFFRGWQKNTGTNLPLVAQNTKMTPYPLPNAPNVVIPARGVMLHPGYQCERAVVRFIAPAAGEYRVSGQFYAGDPNVSGNLQGTQTSNRIVSSTPLNPNLTRHSGSVSLPSQAQSSFTSKLVMLPKDGTLDFEVGCGPGQNFVFGLTGLHAVIERTPRPYCEVPPNTPVSENPCLTD